jgi:hypothetical protein
LGARQVALLHELVHGGALGNLVGGGGQAEDDMTMLVLVLVAMVAATVFYVTYVNGLHAVHLQTEDFRSFDAHNKAHKFFSAAKYLRF